jgi:hypothetical protein
MADEQKPVVEEEVKVEELDDEQLEDASGGSGNSGCNCGCSIE